MKRKTCIFRNFVMLFMAIGLFTVFIGCDDKNDEVGPLRQEVQTLKTDLANLQKAKVAEKVESLEKWKEEAQKKLNNLPANATPEEKEKAQKELLNAVLASEVFKNYTAKVDSIMTNAVTKKDLEDVKKLINGEGDKTSVVSRLAALETILKVKEGKTDIFNEYLKKDNFATEFQTQLTAKDGEFKKLQNAFDVLVNKDDVELPAALKTKFNRLFEDVGLDGDVTISYILYGRLTSLVLLPDYVSYFDGNPVVVFSPINTPCDNTKITPLVEIKYMVNPSTITVADIDVDNLRFVYNDPDIVYGKKTQAELVAPKAKFVSLKNGVLTVKASLNSEETWSNKGGSKVDQLMLQVPSKKTEKGKYFVVNSDWVKVISNPINDYYLGKQNENGSGRQVLPTTLARAKAEPAVVNLAYDESLDLNSFVKTLYGAQGVLNVENYGLSYSYDLNDSEGNAIKYELGGNKTDQQQFIKLNGSTVTTRVYAIDGQNPASVDRTPIVHVVLKSNKCDEMDKEAFIKINIVRSQKDNIKPVDFAPKKDIIASCEDFDLRVGTQEMNEKFYAKAGLSKQEFHRNYTLQYDPSDVDGVGTVSQVRDYNDRESYNLVWNVSSAEQWNALGTGQDAVNEKEISRVVEYRSGNSVIKVTFKATLKRPSIDLSNLKLDNFWSANKQYARFNIVVPENGSKDSSLAKIRLDIDNVFDNEDGNSGDIVIKGWDNKYNYNYTFVEKQSYTNVPSGVEKQVIKLYGSGNMLYAQRYNTETKANVSTPQLVAEISANNIIEYKQTTLAKYLLNMAKESMKVDLQLNASDKCGHSIESNISNGKNEFEVHFLRPINVDPASPKNFIDGVDAGKPGSILDITDIVVLSDWRRYVANNKSFNFEPKNKNYYDYYGVTSIKIDEDNIKVQGLKADGQSISDKPASIDVKQVGTVDPATYKYGKVTYKNNNATLNKAFKLIIPVTVTYKWGEVKTNVTVDVKPTSDASRKRVK